MKSLTLKTPNGEKLIVSRLYCDCENECTCSTELWLQEDEQKFSY